MRHDVGIDQVIFIQQCGTNRHEDIGESLRVFGEQVLPEFAELARKPRRAPIAPEAVATVEAYGRRSAAVRATFSDRGCAISIPQSEMGGGLGPTSVTVPERLRLGPRRPTRPCGVAQR